MKAKGLYGSSIEFKDDAIHLTKKVSRFGARKTVTMPLADIEDIESDIPSLLVPYGYVRFLLKGQDASPLSFWEKKSDPQTFMYLVQTHDIQTIGDIEDVVYIYQGNLDAPAEEAEAYPADRVPFLLRYIGSVAIVAVVALAAVFGLAQIIL